LGEYKYFIEMIMKFQRLSLPEQYELWDEYCKLVSEEDKKGRNMRDEYELEDQIVMTIQMVLKIMRKSMMNYLFMILLLKEWDMNIGVMTSNWVTMGIGN